MEPLLKSRNQLIERHGRLNTVSSDNWQYYNDRTSDEERRDNEAIRTNKEQLTKAHSDLAKILEEEGESDVTVLEKKIVAGIKTFEDNELNAGLLKHAENVVKFSVYKQHHY